MLYVESSAALAWLLGEPAGEAVRGLLAGASAVGSSELTQQLTGRFFGVGPGEARVRQLRQRVREPELVPPRPERAGRFIEVAHGRGEIRLESGGSAEVQVAPIHLFGLPLGLGFVEGAPQHRLGHR